MTRPKAERNLAEMLRPEKVFKNKYPYMCPSMARMKFVQDEVGGKEVILSLLWEINR